MAEDKPPLHVRLADAEVVGLLFPFVRRVAIPLQRKLKAPPSTFALVAAVGGGAAGAATAALFGWHAIFAINPLIGAYSLGWCAWDLRHSESAGIWDPRATMLWMCLLALAVMLYTQTVCGAAALVGAVRFVQGAPLFDFAVEPALWVLDEVLFLVGLYFLRSPAVPPAEREPESAWEPAGLAA